MAKITMKIGLSDSDKTTMANQITAETLNKLIPAFSTSVAYTKGQYTMYSNALYRFTADKSAGEWDSTKVESATLNDLVDDVNEAVADVAHKANIDGYYSTMGVGHADSALSLDTNVGNDDQTPFNYQTAGESSDIATGIQKLKKLVGASVVFNQMININDSSWNAANGTFAKDTANNVVSFTASNANLKWYQQRIRYLKSKIVGHKYYVTALIKSSSDLQGGIDGVNFNLTSTYQRLSFIKTYAQSESNEFGIGYEQAPAEGDVLETKDFMAIDLTQMFGSQVADYIYAKEQANAGDGVAIFKSMFPNDYYAYNTGTFIHSKSAKLKMVDYNQFDGQWGAIVSNIATTTVNYISVIPNKEYNIINYNSSGVQIIDGRRITIKEYDYNKQQIDAIAKYFSNNNPITYTPSSNCCFIKIEITVNQLTVEKIGNLCIFIYWDGSRIGYEPYQEHIYDLPNDELKGILKVVDNKIVADGDEEYPDGTKKTRYGIVDLSTLTWNYSTTVNCWVCPTNSEIKPIGDIGKTNIIADKYTTDTTANIANHITKNTIGINSLSNIFVYNDSDTVKPSGYMIYELAEPSETTSTAFAENIYVDDFGTMEFLDENNARISGIQGNEIFYKANISGFAESLYVKTDGDVDEIVTQEDIDDTALATRGYIKLASITGYDATKTQVLKNVNGTFTWVDET